MLGHVRAMTIAPHRDLPDRPTVVNMFVADHAKPLAEIECQDLLAARNVGRLSLTITALPVVVPVTYGYLGGNIVLAMGDGPAHRAAASHVVGFEIDDTNLDHVLWAVLVIGRAVEITDDTERAQFESLGLAPPAGSPPVHYLKLQPDIVSGYRATCG